MIKKSQFYQTMSPREQYCTSQLKKQCRLLLNIYLIGEYIQERA